MRYVSTRGQTPPHSFEDVLLAGLAPDGGLFLPEAWPQLRASEIAGFAHKPYTEAAFDILSRSRVCHSTGLYCCWGISHTCGMRERRTGLRGEGDNGNTVRGNKGCQCGG